MKATSTQQTDFPRRAGGFTMVEILTVITVMAILMSVAAVGIQKMDQGQATTTGLAITQAIFAEARSVAVGRGTRARVYIHGELNDTDSTDQTRYLRYLIVAAQDETTKKWEVVSRGTALPNSVYFDAEASDDAATSVTDIGTWGEDPSVILPGSRTMGKRCYYYEFNSEGICVDGDEADANPGAALILIGGARGLGQEKPRLIGNNRSGFVVWRNGQTAVYRNPDQIGE